MSARNKAYRYKKLDGYKVTCTIVPIAPDRISVVAAMALLRCKILCSPNAFPPASAKVLFIHWKREY